MTFAELLAIWKIEIFEAPEKKVSLRRLAHKLWVKEHSHYLFWLRLGQYLYRKPSGVIKYKKIAKRIHARLLRTHGIDIAMGAQIGAGLRIVHRVGVVVSGRAIIGRNARILQNTTIGMQHPDQPGSIVIGDNVLVGANSCIIGNNLRIGDDVVIGAMSFVNKDIPSGATFYSTHVPNIRPSAAAQ